MWSVAQRRLCCKFTQWQWLIQLDGFVAQETWQLAAFPEWLRVTFPELEAALCVHVVIAVYKGAQQQGVVQGGEPVIDGLELQEGIVRGSAGAVEIVIQSGKVRGIGGVALEDRSGSVRQAIVESDGLLVPKDVDGSLSNHLTCAGQIKSAVFPFRGDARN